MLSEDKKNEILDDFEYWSGGLTPPEVPLEKIEVYIQNCLLGEDNENIDLKKWLRERE